MNWALILPIIEQTTQVALALVSAGLNAAPALKNLRKLINGEVTTPEELKAIQVANDALHSALQEPLPDDPTGETNV